MVSHSDPTRVDKDENHTPRQRHETLKSFRFLHANSAITAPTCPLSIVKQKWHIRANRVIDIALNSIALGCAASYKR